MAATALGVNAYITKPFSPSQVQEKVMDLIESIETKMDIAS